MKPSNPRSLLALITPVVVAALILGCSGDNDDGDSGSTGSSVSPPGATGSASGENSSEGNSGAAFTVEEMTELARTEVDGYVGEEPIVGTATTNVTVSYEPVEGGTGLSAIVTLAPCDPFLCWDLDGEITEEHEQNLLSMLPRVHIDNPDLIFEYGTMEAAPGYEAFFTYARSFVQEGGTTATTNSYRLIYHDGANLISIQLMPVFGALPESPEEMEMELDQSKGELSAKNFFAAYAGAFEPMQ